MTFTWTTIHVRDLDQSLAFYHDLLGLPIQERFGPPGHEIAMLGPEEGTRLELIGGGEIPQHPAPTLSLGFAPENMGQLLAALEARAIPIRPMSPNPALQFYFLEDPDGYTQRYWVGVETGLLVASERLLEGETIYRMASLTVDLSVPSADRFILPDGTVLLDT